MTQRRKAPLWRWLLLGVSALLPLSCASTSEQPTAASTATVDYRAWEEVTRARADEAMAEAQRLLGEGDTAAALDMADEALCEVLAVPPGYPIRDTYLDYLADLIDEAADIEASLQQFDEEQVVTEDLAALPPVDTLTVAAEVEGVEHITCSASGLIAAGIIGLGVLGAYANARDRRYYRDDDEVCYRGPRECGWVGRRCFENRWGETICRGGRWTCWRDTHCD